MRQPVMLTLQQVMQRQSLRGAVLSAERLQALFDDGLALGDLGQLVLQSWGAGLIRIGGAAIVLRQREQGRPGRAVLSMGRGHDGAQKLAVAGRRDRQPMLIIMSAEAAFIRVVAKFDLALVERLAIGRAEDRQQHAGPAPMRQHVPIDVERLRMARFRSPFEDVEPPGIVRIVHTHVVRDEVEDQARGRWPSARC